MGKRLTPWLAILGVIILALPVMSCSVNKSAGAPLPSARPYTTAAPTATPPAQQTSTAGQLLTSDGGQSQTDRMIVRTGNMTVVVQDVAAAMENISRLANTFSGWVVSSKVWEEGQRTIGVISIRMAPQYYEDTVKAVRDLADQVTAESSSSQDVTAEYVDLQSRLRNLEATRDQILTFLAKAQKVDEALSVQSQLDKVQGDIEQTKGRMQYLESTSSTSLLEIHLEQSKLGVEFASNTAKVNTGQEVQFSAQVAGGFTPFSYEWSFGDNATSTEKDPSHSYKYPGSYTVSLTVTDDKRNSVTQTRNEYVSVVKPPGWSASDIAQGAWHGLTGFGKVLGDIVIWLGILAVIWVPILAIVWWRMRAKRRAGA